MTEIIVALINRKENEEWRKVLTDTCDSFDSDIKEVVYLAQGKM